MRAVYLAARYSRHGEMREVRDVMSPLGYKITSRWIDQHDGELEQSYTQAKLNADPEECGVFGIHDVEDVAAADTVISFTSADGGGKGGRHVEFGLAIGLGKRLIIVGPRENIFHALPNVQRYPTFADLAADLIAASFAVKA